MRKLTKLEKQLIRHEGCKFKPYRCPAGKLTIGIGRNVEDSGISRDEAIYLLRNDIDRCIEELYLIFPMLYNLSSNRQVVLIDMMFNLGLTRFRKFKKMIAAINSEQWIKAANEMMDSLWYKQVGNRAEYLCTQMKKG